MIQSCDWLTQGRCIGSSRTARSRPRIVAAKSVLGLRGLLGLWLGWPHCYDRHSSARRNRVGRALDMLRQSLCREAAHRPNGHARVVLELY